MKRLIAFTVLVVACGGADAATQDDAGPATRYTVGLAAYRLLKRQGIRLTAASAAKAVRAIIEERTRAASRPCCGRTPGPP